MYVATPSILAWMLQMNLVPRTCPKDLTEPSTHPEILFTGSLPYTCSDMDLSVLLVHFLSINPNIGIHTCHTYVQTVIC